MNVVNRSTITKIAKREPNTMHIGNSKFLLYYRLYKVRA